MTKPNTSPALASARAESAKTVLCRLVLAVVLAFLPLGVTVSGDKTPTLGLIAVAHADDGGEGGEGGEGENGGDNGGDDGNGGDNGGDDGNGGDEGEDGDHGEAGSTVEGFLGALVGHGRVRESFADGDTVILKFADGWTEVVDKGRYQLIDRKGRVVVSRKARKSDENRLRAAIGS